MNNKFTTIILTIILIILTIGGIVLGGAIYKDFMGIETDDEVYKIGNIVTEEPTEKKNAENVANIAGISQGISTGNIEKEGRIRTR